MTAIQEDIIATWPSYENHIRRGITREQLLAEGYSEEHTIYTNIPHALPHLEYKPLSEKQQKAHNSPAYNQMRAIDPEATVLEHLYCNTVRYGYRAHMKHAHGTEIVGDAAEINDACKLAVARYKALSVGAVTHDPPHDFDTWYARYAKLHTPDVHEQNAPSYLKARVGGVTRESLLKTGYLEKHDASSDTSLPNRYTPITVEWNRHAWYAILQHKDKNCVVMHVTHFFGKDTIGKDTTSCTTSWYRAHCFHEPSRTDIYADGSSIARACENTCREWGRIDKTHTKALRAEKRRQKALNRAEVEQGDTHVAGNTNTRNRILVIGDPNEKWEVKPILVGEGENSPEPAQTALTAEQLIDMIEGSSTPESCAHMELTDRTEEEQQEEGFPVELCESKEEIEQAQTRREAIAQDFLTRSRLEAALTQNAPLKGFMTDRNARNEAEGVMRLLRGHLADLRTLQERSTYSPLHNSEREYYTDMLKRYREIILLVQSFYDLTTQYKLTLMTEDDHEEQEIGRAYLEKIERLEPSAMWGECPSEVYKNALDREFDYRSLYETLKGEVDAKNQKLENARKGILVAFAHGWVKAPGLLSLLGSHDIIGVGEHQLPTHKLEGLSAEAKLEILAFATWVREMGAYTDWIKPEQQQTVAESEQSEQSA